MAQVEGAACTAVLEVREGLNQGSRYTYDRHATMLVGRGKDAHLRLINDPFFSRHHCLFEFLPPHGYLRDLGSRNGTFVNGTRVREAFLKDGDLVGGGRTRMRFRVCNAPAPSPPASRAELTLPPHVPGYEIERPLGQGRHGTVYLARRGGEAVALKVLQPTASLTNDATAALLRYAIKVKELELPRIARIHECGVADGLVYLATEYVEAVDLPALLAKRSKPKAAKMACAIFCQALEGLHLAHEKGFVHRDIKPANLLVCREGRKLRVKLTDFGLARQVEDAGLFGLTRAGEVRDRLELTAPEVAADCRNDRRQADIYGIAATLYALLAQAPPHVFAPGKDPHTVLLETDPVPLHERCPGVLRGLSDVIHKALARRPRKRFASAAEMFHDLLPFAR